MEIYPLIVHLHSVLRWVLLVLVLATIAMAFRKGSQGIPAMKPALWSMAAAHAQLLLGLVLYFISDKVVFSGEAMKSTVLRFYLVEHILVMIMAVALITIGYLRAKKIQEISRKKSNLLLYFIIALLLILSRIPWPFLNYGGKWI